MFSCVVPSQSLGILESRFLTQILVSGTRTMEGRGWQEDSEGQGSMYLRLSDSVPTTQCYTVAPNGRCLCKWASMTVVLYTPTVALIYHLLLCTLLVPNLLWDRSS